MAAVDALEALRRELVPPPVDLSPLLAQLTELRRDLARLAARELAAPESLIDLREVCSRTGFGRTSLLERLAAGTFPPSVEHGGTRLMWRASEVEAWLKSLPSRPGAGGTDAR